MIDCHNIWGFLLQTVSVSLTAILLMVVKWLLADKLSPRWQYGVWSILAVRVLLPVTSSGYVWMPFSLWLETWKAMVERTLDSAYTQVYAQISISFGLPIVDRFPESVTDWLFLIYIAGVLGCLLWYAASYCRLRRLLRYGRPVSEEVQNRITGVCEKYDLKGCRAIQIPGLSSAFICGVIRPVLVIPAQKCADDIGSDRNGSVCGETGAIPDDKILLHELMHQKYQDALQNLCWCVLRAFHWCNPFLHYVFNRIGNDMESLCDQRVLEHLKGEERREYGKILLSMANEQYARAPGTTSLSNGGRNISRRITAITRFKKYPKGMELVSVCIMIVLACPVVIGTSNTCGWDPYFPFETKWKFEQSMAMARVDRCTTVAGALDTYAKGLMNENGSYIATASSITKHKELADTMRYHTESEDRVSYHLDAGSGLEYVDSSAGYYIYNLEQLSNGSYEAILGFDVTAFLNEDGEGLISDEEGNHIGGCVLIPVIVSYEDAWVVEERGERQKLYGVNNQWGIYSDHDEIPWIRQYAASGESGSVTVKLRTVYMADVQNSTWSFGNSFADSAKRNAEFNYGYLFTYAMYTCDGSSMGEVPESAVAIQLTELSSVDEEPENKELVLVEGYGGTTSSSDGRCSGSKSIDQDWDGTVDLGGGMTESGHLIKEPISLPEAYWAGVFWDDQLVEELKPREVVQ